MEDIHGCSSVGYPKFYYQKRIDWQTTSQYSRLFVTLSFTEFADAAQSVNLCINISGARKYIVELLSLCQYDEKVLHCQVSTYWYLNYMLNARCAGATRIRDRYFMFEVLIRKIVILFDVFTFVYLFEHFSSSITYLFKFLPALCLIGENYYYTMRKRKDGILSMWKTHQKSDVLKYFTT